MRDELTIEQLRERAQQAQDDSDYLTLESIARDIIRRCEENGDGSGLAWGYLHLGSSCFQRNDGAGADRALQRAADLFQAASDHYGQARALLNMGAVAIDVHLDVGRARHLYDLGVPLMREGDDRNRLAIALGNFGEICRLEGHPAQALRYATESLSIFRDLGMRTNAGWQLSDIAHYHLLLKDFGAAADNLRAAYEELSVENNPRWIAWCFDIWFILAATLERWEVAASLLGFVDHYRDVNAVPRMQALLPWFSLPVERLAKRARDDEHLHDLRIAGEALTVMEAHDLATHIDL